MYFKQVQEIAEGRKTVTQRIMKSNEHYNCAPDGSITRVMTAANRIKWRVGQDYAVSPGQGKRGLYVDYFAGGGKPILYSPEEYERDNRPVPCEPLRIRLTAIELVRLHTVDDRVALAEGVGSVEEYRTLWESINGVGSWSKDPLVWRLWFERA